MSTKTDLTKQEVKLLWHLHGSHFPYAALTHEETLRTYGAEMIASLAAKELIGVNSKLVWLMSGGESVIEDWAEQLASGGEAASIG